MDIKRFTPHAVAALGAASFVFALSAVSSEAWWNSEKGSHGIWSVKISDEKKAISIGEYEGYKGLEAVRGFQLTNVLILLAATVFSLLKAFKSDQSRASGIGSAFITSFTFSVFTVGAISSIDPIKYLGEDFSYGTSYILCTLQMGLVFVCAVLSFVP